MERVSRGHCLCGAVTFEARGESLWQAVCHCESCRRATSSPVTAFVGFPRDAVTWSGELPGRYQHSEKAERLFCARCGSQLAYVSSARTDQIDLYTAAFENPDAFPPTKTAYASEALDFTKHISELPDWT